MKDAALQNVPHAFILPGKVEFLSFRTGCFVAYQLSMYFMGNNKDLLV